MVVPLGDHVEAAQSAGCLYVLFESVEVADAAREGKRGEKLYFVHGLRGLPHGLLILANGIYKTSHPLHSVRPAIEQFNNGHRRAVIGVAAFLFVQPLVRGFQIENAGHIAGQEDADMGVLALSNIGGHTVQMGESYYFHGFRDLVSGPVSGTV